MGLLADGVTNMDVVQDVAVADLGFGEQTVNIAPQHVARVASGLAAADIAGVVTAAAFSPTAIIVATVLLTGLVAMMWFNARGVVKDADTGKKRKQAAGAADWLWMLTVASIGLLGIQLSMGYFFGSLTLLADSAHTAADGIGYGFAYIVERAKVDINLAKGAKSSRLIMWIDFLSAGFSVLVVLGTTGSAAWEAIGRLQKDDSAEAESDFRHMGAALLTFAIISTLMNVILLVMHPLYVKKPDVEESIEEETVALLEPPPPPMPYGMDAPPPPVPDGISARRAKRSSKKPERSSMKLLHMAFHAGCDGEHCIDQHGQAASDDSSVSDSSPLTKKIDSSTKIVHPEDSMNLRGAHLHLLTDILRSLIIFVAGSLVLAGTIKKPIKADAVCALLVAACVVIGSIMIICTMISKLRQLTK